jgi:hypothetical protein
MAPTLRARCRASHFVPDEVVKSGLRHQLKETRIRKILMRVFCFQSNRHGLLCRLMRCFPAPHPAGALSRVPNRLSCRLLMQHIPAPHPSGTLLCVQNGSRPICRIRPSASIVKHLYHVNGAGFFVALNRALHGRPRDRCGSSSSPTVLHFFRHCLVPLLQDAMSGSKPDCSSHPSHPLA